MDGTIRRPRQKLPFTIENILSRHPDSSAGQRSAGLDERAALLRTEVFPCAGLCCCCCCCCGGLLPADFSHRGELKCSWSADPRRPGDPCREQEEEQEEQENPGPVQRRTRRHRTIFTEEQLDALEELFLQNQYPDVNTREKLAQQTHLREERVEVEINDPQKMPSYMFADRPETARSCCSVDRCGSKTAEQSGGARKDHLLHWTLKTDRSEQSLPVTDACAVSQRRVFACRNGHVSGFASLARMRMLRCHLRSPCLCQETALQMTLMKICHFYNHKKNRIESHFYSLFIV